MHRERLHCNGIASLSCDGSQHDFDQKHICAFKFHKKAFVSNVAAYVTVCVYSEFCVRKCKTLGILNCTHAEYATDAHKEIRECCALPLQVSSMSDSALMCFCCVHARTNAIDAHVVSSQFGAANGASKCSFVPQPSPPKQRNSSVVKLLSRHFALCHVISQRVFAKMHGNADVPFQDLSFRA